MSAATETTTTSPAAVRSRRGRRLLGVVLAVLIILLGLASFFLYKIVTPVGGSDAARATADAGGLVWVRSIYGMSDKPADQLDQPQAAVPAADGSLWITDGVHRALMHFRADGQYIGSMQGPADAPLLAPSRIAVDADGTIYACETMSDTVRIISKNNLDAGSFNIPQPVSVAVSDDRIVVGAVSGFAILDKTGKPIKVIGARGKGDDQFDYVHGVAFDTAGNIYVSDSYNNRISAYDPDGKRLWIIRTGKPGNNAQEVDNALTVADPGDAVLKGEDAMQLPLGLTIDGAGRVVVVDMFDCTIAVFNAKDGSFVGKYGVEGADDGQFFYPTSISYDPTHDWFAVADNLNNRVELVRIPGSAAGNGALAAVRRTLSGPLRACIYPFLLLLLALIVWAVTRARRSKEQTPENAESLTSISPTEE